MEEGEVLFLQEDPGDRFYIILEGSIRLAIQNQPETVVRMRLERDSYPEKFCKEDWLRDGDIGKILKDLDKGTAFGELSMINNYQNRTTSCFCCSDTAQLCVVDKSLYEDTLKLYHSNKADHMTISKTLMSFPLFTAWNHETIQDLSDKMSIRTFQRGFKVGAKRKPFKMLTVVVKGEVVIVGGRGTDAILSRVGPGGIVGDIELYNGIKNHCLDSVVNSSECVCYQVHKEDFVGATKYDTETNERMRSHANDKMKFHSERWRIERKKERKRKRGGAGEKEEKVKGSVDLNLGILDKINLERSLAKQEMVEMEKKRRIEEEKGRNLPAIVQRWAQSRKEGQRQLQGYSSSTGGGHNLTIHGPRMATAGSGIGSHVSLAKLRIESYSRSVKEIMFQEQMRKLTTRALNEDVKDVRLKLTPLSLMSSKK